MRRRTRKTRRRWKSKWIGRMIEQSARARPYHLFVSLLLQREEAGWARTTSFPELDSLSPIASLEANDSLIGLLSRIGRRAWLSMLYYLAVPRTVFVRLYLKRNRTRRAYSPKDQVGPSFQLHPRFPSAIDSLRRFVLPSPKPNAGARPHPKALSRIIQRIGFPYTLLGYIGFRVVGFRVEAAIKTLKTLHPKFRNPFAGDVEAGGAALGEAIRTNQAHGVRVYLGIQNLPF